ncbi:glycogen(starch) synthase [Micromonospora pallida]|uniref:Glycogen(Starch) synthase n=1 Tax=Micromonospora pallida TaxID=145854 RepID=A0A1C6SRG0_9ACTN|nr:glycosyltransferase [Micromonospora pallida]SCL32126.1 glycogen(starch) synthase [Micromonospora pallida]
MTTTDRTVLYLALGRSRVAATAGQLARLVAAGHPVVAVLAGVPEWRSVDLPDGVTVHRVAADPRQAVQAARKLLQSAGGPLDGAGLVVAGDPEAVPAAWFAQRRRPDLPVRFAPAPDPDRRPAPADVAVVTAFYPAPGDPLAGAAVRESAIALGQRYGRVSVLHTDEWRAPRSSATPLVTVTLDRLARRVDPVTVTDEPEAEVTRVAVPMLVAAREYPVRAAGHLAAARAALPGGRIEAPVVYAFGGVLGGTVATALARPDARLVVVEHSPLLAHALAQPAVRDQYEQVLTRADEVLCVSQYLADALAGHFPEHLAKVRVVPTLVDVDALPTRSTPPTELRRWVHVGPLWEVRGQSVVLESFAELAAQDPTATLTLLDATATSVRQRDRIGVLKLRDRVTFRATSPAPDLATVLADYDLLVHANQGEGHGELLVTAAATGTPVLVAEHPASAEAADRLAGTPGALVEQGTDARELLAGRRRLTTRLVALDPVTARSGLRERHGAATVLPRLLGETAAEPAAVPDDGSEPAAGTARPGTSAKLPDRGERVVLVAINAPRFFPARDLALRAAAAGYGVDVITHDANLWREAARDPRLRIHPIDVAESRRPVLRAEQTLVYRAPGKLLATVRERTRRQEAIWPELGVLTAQRAHGKLAGLIHQKGFEKGYRLVRPRVMWRIVRQHVLPKLDLARTRRVVVAGTNGLTVGWQLARRHPEITVTTSLSGFEETGA